MNATRATQPTASVDRIQLVTFRLGEELYGVRIEEVLEVLPCGQVRTVPNAPAFVLGVIELRDLVIPVVDLHARLGLPEPDAGRRRILVLDVGRRLGVVVDDIAGVVWVERRRIEDLPDLATGAGGGDCVRQLAHGGDHGLVILLHPPALLSPSERHALAGLAPGTAGERS
jgi:purine-binding chemotaxis protein CheW